MCYESCKLNEREWNYVVPNLELASIAHALIMWHHYLLGKTFLILTNNTCINNLFIQPELNSRQAIWMDFLSEFYFKVKDMKGKENKVADVLSRRTHEIYEITMSKPESDIRRRIKTTSLHDIEYMNLWNKLQKDEINLNEKKFKVDHEGTIWFKNRFHMPKFVEIKLLILNKMHKPPYEDHRSYKKMITSPRK